MRGNQPAIKTQFSLNRWQRSEEPEYAHSYTMTESGVAQKEQVCAYAGPMWRYNTFKLIFSHSA